MEKYVEVPKSDIVEKTAKKTLHGGDTVVNSKKIVENVLGKKYNEED